MDRPRFCQPPPISGISCYQRGLGFGAAKAVRMLDILLIGGLWWERERVQDVGKWLKYLSIASIESVQAQLPSVISRITHQSIRTEYLWKCSLSRHLLLFLSFV